MSAAIHTKYGNRAGAGYISAWAKDGKGEMVLRLPYAHELHHSRRHPAAAKALAERLGWRGLWIIGHNEDGSICAVNVPGSYSRAWVDKYIPGFEGEDWFFLEETR